MPALTSAIETPGLTGSPPSSPVTLMSPLNAWRIRSKPPREASGPVRPYPVIEQSLARYDKKRRAGHHKKH